MTQIKDVRFLSEKYKPFNITDEARYRYSCLIKYQKLREKGLSENEALEIIEVRRSTLFNWKKRFNDK